MSPVLPPLAQAWDEALERYDSMPTTHVAAAFNVSLLGALRPRWATRVRVTTSMNRLMFTRPNEHHYDESTSEWATAELLDADQVEVALTRRVPRGGLEPVGGGTCAVAVDLLAPSNVSQGLEGVLAKLVER